MNSKPTIKVLKISKQADTNMALAIRHEVFVIEQNCPPELELEHEAESVHFLAFIDHEPAATARWRKTQYGFKLERFAVLRPYRTKGIGKALMQAVLADISPKTEDYIYLNAQTAAVPFY